MVERSACPPITLVMSETPDLTSTMSRPAISPEERRELRLIVETVCAERPDSEALAILDALGAPARSAQPTFTPAGLDRLDEILRDLRAPRLSAIAARVRAAATPGTLPGYHAPLAPVRGACR